MLLHPQHIYSDHRVGHPLSASVSLMALVKECQNLYTPNFDEISQSAAELLLPVSESGRPPY